MDAETASAQKWGGREAAIISAEPSQGDDDAYVQQRHSEHEHQDMRTGQEYPCSARKPRNSWEINSPAESARKVRMGVENWV